MNDQTAAERAILGTLIETNGETPLPLPLLQLLDNAPESFGDLKNQAIAVAIKDLKAAGKPLHVLSVRERLQFPDSDAYLSQVISDALPMDLAAMEAETIWTGYRTRRACGLFSEAADALISSPQLARAIIGNVRSTLYKLDDENQKDGLPDLLDGAALLQLDPVLPETLIDGVLHKGSKLSLGGASKAYKSWTFLNLALSLATGEPWLDFPCSRCRVLYVNLEIQPGFIHRRLKVLCLARNLSLQPGWLDIWNLRGFTSPHSVIIPKIIKRARDVGYGLAILDPHYKLFDAGSNENAAVDVNQVMNSFERLSTETGAAVAYGSHFAKGNAAAKESIDRVSGSGVFARDPDTILTFTKHEQDDCFTVELTHRNLPPIPPFVVKWQYPQFSRQPDLDPADLKKRPGRPKSFSDTSVLDLLSDHPLSSGNWSKQAQTELGVSRTVFYEIKDRLSGNGLALKSKINGLWTRVNPR